METTPWPHVFTEVGDAHRVRRIPSRIGLHSRSPADRGVQLTLVGGSESTSGVLAGSLTLGHAPESPQGVSADLHEIWGRISALVRIGEPPVTSAWLRLGLDQDIVHLVGVELEHNAARLVEQEILDGLETSSMANVEVIVGTRGIRPEQPATVTVGATVLAAIGVDLGSEGHPVSILYEIIDDVIERFGSSWGVTQSSGPIDDLALRIEVVHRLVELGGATAVSGPSEAAAPDHILWTPPPVGDVHLDLRSRRTAAVRRHLSVGLGALVADLDSETRRTLIRRHHSMPFVEQHTIAVWPRSLPSDVATIEGEIRHPEGARRRTDLFTFDGTSGHQLLFHGHTHPGGTREAGWTLHLKPGPLMKEAGMARVMVLDGEIELSALTRLSCGLEAFDISVCTITVDPDVLDVATSWRADLVANGTSIVSTFDQFQAGSRSLVVPADVEADLVSVVVEVFHEPTGVRKQVVVAPEAAGTHLRVGLAHVLIERPTVLVKLNAASHEAVQVVIDLWKNPTDTTHIELRPGDEPKRWRIPVDTVFEHDTAYHYRQHWLLPPSRRVEVAALQTSSRALVLKPPK